MIIKHIIRVCVLALLPLSSAYAADSLTKEEAYKTALDGLNGIPCDMVVPYMKQNIAGMQMGFELGVLTKRDFENSIHGSTLAATKYAKDNCPELYNIFQKAGGLD